MKARVKATGEIFEIASYARIPMECCDSFGNPLSFSFDEVKILSEENDLKESEVPDYWTRLEHQYAGMAMQGMLVSHRINSILENGDVIPTGIAMLSRYFAHALVEELKGKEERK